MCKSILHLVNVIATITAFVYLIKIYYDTKIDVFQQKIVVGEKENYFIDPAQNPNQLLKYEPQCQIYEKKIMEPNTQKLGDVFKLNMGIVHTRIAIILFINISILIFLLIFILAIVLIKLIPTIGTIFGIFILVFSIVMYIAMIVSNIIFILLIYSYYSGDTNTYNNFLSCKNVNYDGFSRYRIVEKFRYDFKYFMIFNIISLILNFTLNRNNNTE